MAVYFPCNRAQRRSLEKALRRVSDCRSCCESEPPFAANEIALLRRARSLLVLPAILQRRLAASWSGQRNICAERIRQNRGIDANLRYIAVRFCVREKFAVTLFDENAQHCLFKCRIRRVAVRFPVAIDEINFDAAANWFTAIYPNRDIAKIRSSFAIPGAELDDVDLVAGSRDKMFAEIPGEPARLQL
jgi:hypothetical protein